MRKRKIVFPGTRFPPVFADDLTALSEILTVQNSPVLFGCRSGVCGTCLIEVEHIGEETLPPPDAAEAEALEIYAPGNERARLACQIRVCADIEVRLECSDKWLECSDK